LHHFVQKLEKLLPAKPKTTIPTGDNVEEVSMVDFENTRGSSKSSHKARAGPTSFGDMMMGDDDEDEDGDEGGAGQRVECNTH